MGMTQAIKSMIASKPFIDLTFDQKWAYIPPVRIFIQHCLEVALDDGQKAEDAAMAINELLENALKYSDQSEFTVQLTLDQNMLIARVQNHATAENTATLQEILSMLASLDPDTGYLEMMERSLELDDDCSQLGLARIAFEFSAKLDLHCKDGVIIMTACLPL